MSVPNDVLEEAANITAKLLPEKSVARYEKEYHDFKKWQKRRQVIVVNEEVLLVYIGELSTKFSPNSLWSKWSMLKSCLEVRENVQVRRFHKIIAFLKRKNERYVPKKAKVLTKDQIEQFIIDAPDDQYLLYKVITIFGIFGTCRCDELLRITLDDIEDLQKYIIITLKNTKNYTTRRFTITDDDCSFQPCSIYRKYAALRELHSRSLRLFLTYRNGKCISLNAGQHTIGNIPKKIAQYLKLSDPQLYTGHSFRRSAATMVVNAGGDVLALKRAGGWKSSTVAEGYVDEAITNKIQMAKRMFPKNNKISDMSSTSCESTGEDNASTMLVSQSSKFHFSGNSNCSITINVNENK